MATATATFTVTMDSEGRLTVPLEVRQALDVDGETHFAYQVVDDRLILYPIPEEDRWLYTPEHIARVKKALQAPPESWLQLSQEDLERLAPVEPE